MHVQVDVAVENWHATQPTNIPQPVVINHPIDPVLQTGESQQLGGAIEIKAPWRR